MQKILIAALTASLLIPTAVLAENGTLSPGKPAGVRAAQMDTTTLLVGLGAVAIVVGVAVSASSCCQNSNTPVPVAAAPTTTV